MFKRQLYSSPNFKSDGLCSSKVNLHFLNFVLLSSPGERKEEYEFDTVESSTTALTPLVVKSAFSGDFKIVGELFNGDSFCIYERPGTVNTVNTEAENPA